MDPDDLQSPHARSQGAAQSSDFSSLPVLAGEPDGLVLYHIASSDGLQSHGACEQKAASSIPGNAAMFGAVTASDNQQLDLRNDVHVTWTAGIAGGSADGTTTTAMASTVADVVQYNLRSPYGQGLTAQRTADAESHPRPYKCGSTATRNADDDVILLQRPSTGGFIGLDVVLTVGVLHTVRCSARQPRASALCRMIVLVTHMPKLLGSCGPHSEVLHGRTDQAAILLEACAFLILQDMSNPTMGQ